MDLSWLLLLACPIGMGLMMWIMMRGNQDKQAQQRGAQPADDVASLRRQLQSLEDQQKAILARMQRLSEPGADGEEATRSTLRRPTETESKPQS